MRSTLLLPWILLAPAMTPSASALAQVQRFDSTGPAQAYVEIDTTQHRVSGFGLEEPNRRLLDDLIAFVEIGAGIVEIDSSTYSVGLPSIGPLVSTPALSLFLPGPTNFWYSNVITSRGSQELVIGYGVRVDDPPLNEDGERLASGAELVFTVQINNNSDSWVSGLKLLRYFRPADPFDSVTYESGTDGIDFTEDDLVRYDNSDGSYLHSLAGPDVVGRQLDSENDGSLLTQIRSGSPLTGTIVGPLSFATAENAWENGPFSIPPRGALIFGLPRNATTASAYVTVAEQGTDLLFGDTGITANFGTAGTDGQITAIHYRQIPWGSSFGRKLTKTGLRKPASSDSPINVAHHWIVGVNKQNFVVNLTFSYNPTEDGITDEAALVLMTRPSATDLWTEYTDVTRIPEANQIRANNVTASAEWALSDPSALPVQLASFSARSTGDGILLEWQTASETNNLGFHVYRAIVTSDILPSTAEYVRMTSSLIPGAGTTETPSSYRYLDRTALPGRRYAYLLEQVDTDGTTERSDPVLVALDPPTRLWLSQNHPNPFNPTTTIRFELAATSRVRLTVFDVRGRTVAVLKEGEVSAGRHTLTWNGTDRHGHPLPSGVYLLQLTAGQQRLLRRMLLLR